MRNFILSAGLLCCVIGCGGGGGATVTGKVTLDDGSTAPRGTVTIRAEATSFRGAIGPDGSYTIENVTSGEYAVAVSGVTSEEVDSEAGMGYDDETGQYSGDVAEPPKSLISAIYFNPQTSGLTISVPGGQYDLQLEVADGAPAGGAPAGGAPAAEGSP